MSGESVHNADTPVDASNVVKFASLCDDGTANIPNGWILWTGNPVSDLVRLPAKIDVEARGITRFWSNRTNEFVEQLLSVWAGPISVFVAYVEYCNGARWLVPSDALEPVDWIGPDGT